MNSGPGVFRVLALDVGTVRVGVAVSDPLGLTAQPLSTLQRKPDQLFYEKLANIVEEYQVETIVLGLPIGLKGQRGDSWREVQTVLEKIRSSWPDLVVETFDERFTSTMAQRVTREAPKKKKRDKGLVDQVAAQLILQHYLESKRV